MSVDLAPASDLTQLVTVSRRIAEESRGLVILSEGNTSVSADADTFWVKASGMRLRDAEAGSFVRVNYEPLFAVLNANGEGAETALMESVADGSALRPSVEAYMHAWLLRQPGVNAVIHTHPVALLPLVCHPDWKFIGDGRFFPDEVVLCGVETGFVPYVNPGWELAVAIARECERLGDVPRTIWLQNHGLITTGENLAQAEAATHMAVKAAEIRRAFLTSTVRPVPMDPAEVHRIAGREDEHYRQKLLWR